MPLLEVRNLRKLYDGRAVLDGVTFSLERGETLVMLGTSGSGKSTLARILVGLETATSGQILLDGADVCTMSGLGLERARLRFGMVFQKYALLDSLSVFDNVAFPLREREHVGRREVEERVMLMLKELGLEDARKKLPGEISGGMAKRVGIARAMVMGPEILVYDEPTSGLDPITARQVDALIEQLRVNRLVTSIVITHDMASAFTIADKVVFLHQGRIQREGTPDSLLKDNASDAYGFARASGLDPNVQTKPRKNAKEIEAEWLSLHPVTQKSPAENAFWRRLVPPVL